MVIVDSRDAPLTKWALDNRPRAITVENERGVVSALAAGVGLSTTSQYADGPMRVFRGPAMNEAMKRWPEVRALLAEEPDDSLPRGGMGAWAILAELVGLNLALDGTVTRWPQVVVIEPFGTKRPAGDLKEPAGQ